MEDGIHSIEAQWRHVAHGNWIRVRNIQVIESVQDIIGFVYLDYTKRMIFALFYADPDSEDYSPGAVQSLSPDPYQAIDILERGDLPECFQPLYDEVEKDHAKSLETFETILAQHLNE